MPARAEQASGSLDVQNMAAGHRLILAKQEIIIFLALFLLAFVLFWQFGIDWQPVGLDPGMQVYIAQEMLRGHPPYLSVIFPKTPLTATLSALAILVGDRLAIPDIISVRILFLGIGSLVVPITFLVARYISPDLIPRLAAALTLLGFNFWGFSSAAGPEPKILMIVCGLASLWAVSHSHWFLAGLLGSLSFLTWQPAGVYPALALLAALAAKGEHRRKAFLRTLVGVLLPIALVAIYLLVVGAMIPAIRQTLLSQLAYLAALEDRLADGANMNKNFTRLLRVGGTVLAPEILFAVPGILGFLGLTIQAPRTWLKARSDWQIYPWPLILSGYFWLLFSLRDFNYAPDLIPLLPYFALGLGWLLARVIALLNRWPTAPSRTGRLSPILGIAAIFITLLYGLGDFPPPKDPNGLTLQDQTARVAEIDAFLGSQGQVQAVGDLSILVLSERSNLTPLIHLGPKHYNLILHEPGGLEAILAAIQQSEPKVLVLHPRIQNRSWAQPFRDLAEDAYQPYLTSPHREESQVFAHLVVEEQAEVDHRALFQLGDNFRLIGYRLDDSQIAGSRLAVTLFWESFMQSTGDDYTVFLHLVDGRGNILAQDDGPPASGYYPTSFWEVGNIIEDTHLIVLPSDLAPGAYSLRLGMYLLQTMERLPVTGEGGQRLANDEIVIEGIEFGD